MKFCGSRGFGLGAWAMSVVFVVGVAGAETIVPAGGQIDDLEARLTYARILSYRAETWTDAAAAYERLLRENPGHAAALTELVELRVRQGDFAGAEQRLRAALQARPGEPATTAALAKLFWWTNRPADAQALFASVATGRALTPEEKLVSAQTLTRLGRHAEANRRFDEILAQSPTPASELLSAAADARLVGGDTPAARELYRRALAGDASLAGAQRGYALTLAWTGDDAAARPRLKDVLVAQPNDGDVIHAYVRSIDHLSGTAAAIAEAKARATAAPRDPIWRAEWAELAAQRGHAVRSRQLFAEALALGATPALRLRAGRAAITWGDFNGAERALRDEWRLHPADARVRDELGQLLLSADRLEEAEQFYEQWLYETPAAEPALLGLARLRVKEKNYAAALVRCDAVLVLRPDAPEARRLKADVLLATHRAREAAEIYGSLTALPAERREAEIGLGRAARETTGEKEAETHFTAAAQTDPGRPAARFFLAGRAVTAKDDFLLTLTGGAEKEYQFDREAPAGSRAVPESAPQLVEWANLFVEHGEFGRAVRCLQSARVADPDYYPAWTQLAELLAIDAQFEVALREFARLRAAMPDNRQVLLGEARAMAWSRRYDESLAAYARLAALNPADPVPRREAARTAGWGKRRERGAELYATAWCAQPVDRALAGLLRPALEGAAGSELVATWRQWTENPAESVEPFVWTERFAADRFALREALPENRRARLDQVYLQLLPDLRQQRAWWLENLAKQFAWDRRYTSAVTTYRRLLVFEPGNEEAWFDFSQALAAQGLGEGEHAALTKLLALDANHSLATHAVRRREIRSQPMATVETRYWREQGRGDLSSMGRLFVAGEVQETYGEQINLRLLAEVGREMPRTRDGRYAYRGFGLGVDGVVNDWLSGSANLLHRKFYDARLGAADSGQIQLWAKGDSFAAGVGYERREELGNEFALFQGTHSDQVWLGGTAALARKLDLEARLTSTGYSDSNRGIAFVLRPAYAWTDHPRVFKTTLTLEMRHTNAASIYVPGPTRLTNIIHPYWTPRDYLHAGLTLELFHDLAKEFFVGSEEHFYDLRLTLGSDSESNPAVTWEADWHREWWDRWVAHAGLYLNFSRAWDALGLNLKMARRF